MLKLRPLEVFRATMASGTMTGAAAQLGMSQPAVSQMLRHLEDQLGYPLFLRVKGRLQPTHEAELLFAEVDKIFFSLTALEQLSRGLRDARSGTLVIGSTPILSCTLLVEAIRRVRARRPKVNVWVQVVPTRDMISSVRNKQIDLALTHVPGDDSNLTVMPLFETELVCVMHRDHPLAVKPIIEAKDLQQYPIVMNVRNEQIKVLLSEAFYTVDIPSEAIISTNQVLTTCFLARAGLGVALVEAMGLSSLFPDLIQRPFRPRVVMQPRVLYSPEQPLSRMAQFFLATLREVASTYEQTDLIAAG
jgi:DNA-binding transcriptional LysR family regulator